MDKYISIRYKCRICGFDSESKIDIEKHIEDCKLKLNKEK